jgi:hypothetical protein
MSMGRIRGPLTVYFELLLAMGTTLCFTSSSLRFFQMGLGNDVCLENATYVYYTLCRRSVCERWDLDAVLPDLEGFQVKTGMLSFLLDVFSERFVGEPYYRGGFDYTSLFYYPLYQYTLPLSGPGETRKRKTNSRFLYQPSRRYRPSLIFVSSYSLSQRVLVLHSLPSSPLLLLLVEVLSVPDRLPRLHELVARRG